jgi:hypothetical protein
MAKKTHNVPPPHPLLENRKDVTNLKPPVALVGHPGSHDGKHLLFCLGDFDTVCLIPLDAVVGHEKAADTPLGATRLHVAADAQIKVSKTSSRVEKLLRKLGGAESVASPLALQTAQQLDDMADESPERRDLLCKWIPELC